MGNKGSSNRRHVVDNRYTRPQGLYQHQDLDEKRLKKSILEFKLSPCYIGEDEFHPDLEECPICFLYYPSLNRSKCCSKSICTECFLQVKPYLSTRHVQCPFCKTANYAVEYWGVKTMEEKQKDQIEEQKVIEAQLRVRQQEILDENERLQKRKNTILSSTTSPNQEEYRDLCGVSHSVAQTTTESEEFLSSRSSSRSLSTRPSPSRNVRNGNLDLEEVMLMEAIWLSIQEHESPSNQTNYQNTLETLEPTPSPNSSTGFASAVADLAERQHRLLEPFSSSSNYIDNDLLEPSSSSPIRGVVNGDAQSIDQWSTLGAEVDRNVPEGFEEQMRLALAVSLAEARARVST
ncbi:hypothetical protein LUZ60_013322 [Juncus effusus]|nr:hypothetical protein LUZ60_013322 [Juncus effusus]